MYVLPGSLASCRVSKVTLTNLAGKTILAIIKLTDRELRYTVVPIGSLPMGISFDDHMPNPKSITVQELIALALPREIRVLAGHGELNRTVNWVTAVSTADDSRNPAPGDLVILLPSQKVNWATQWTRLGRVGIAAIAIVGEPPTALVELATQAGMPLLSLPRSTDVRLIERTALAHVLGRSAAIEERTAQLYQQLTTLSAENAGWESMATLIGQSTGKTVLIQDKRLDILAGWFTPDLSAQRKTIETWMTAAGKLPEALRDRRHAAQTLGGLQQDLEIDSLSRLVAPIIAKGIARGFLSLVAEVDAWSTFDRRAAETCAAACALEMAKAKAVSEAEKRVRGNFVDAVLGGGLAPLEMDHWAKRNRYAPDGRHATLVAEWSKKEHPSNRRLETLTHGIAGRFRGEMLAQARENEIVIFARLDPRPGIEAARHIAESIRHQAANEFPNDPLAIGIGRSVDALSGLRDSYRQARQALSMARRLADPNPLYFGELNVYRLLFQLEHTPELESFCREMIGTLIEYDRAQGTDLVETLSAFFAHNGNLSQTAEALFVHRNTLLYRMERIREISGLDLDNPETRLSIQLALRARRLLTAGEE